MLASITVRVFQIAYIKRPKNDRIQLIEMLVNSGADVNERDEFGATPLDYVCGEHYDELREILIRLGAVE